MGGAPTHVPVQQLIDTHKPQISSTYRRCGSDSRRRRSNWLNHFPEGSLVEVQTNEEDFKGVYFSATVISSSPISPKKGSSKNSKKLYVEYHNLLDDENDSKRLKEQVEISFVRPAPPFLELITSFEQDDVVDAFCKDGWWSGTVTQVVEGGERYIVTFQYPPDELEFGLVELRAHWDWVDGSWIRPENKIKTGLMFDKGRKVEVSFDREDRQDAWFPGTIHEILGDGAFLVEYCSSDIRKEHQTVKVTIDSLHVRPSPPLLKDKKFALLEKVDAFFDFGWWSGVVTKVLENSRYIVFFKQMKRDKEFDQNELRPHMRWKDGRWFTSSQLSQDALDDRKHGLGDRNGTSDDKAPPGYALSQPPRNPKKGNIVGSDQHGPHDRSIKDSLLSSPLSDSESDIISSAARTSKENQSSDNLSSTKRLQRKQRKVGATGNAEENANSTPSSMEKGSTQTLQIENSGTIAEGREPDAVGNSGENVQSEHTKKETELPVIIGLPCAEKGSSRSGISGTKRARRSDSKEILKIVSDEQHQLNDSIVQEMKDIKQLQTGELSKKKKRGRPRKTLIEDIQTLLTGTIDFFTVIQSMQIDRFFAVRNTQNGAAVSVDLSQYDDDRHGTPEMVAPSSNQKETVLNRDKLTNAQSDSPNRTGRMTKRSLTKLQNEKVIKDSIGMQENRSSKRVRRLMTDKNIALQALDTLDASGDKMIDLNCTMEVDKVVTEASSNEFENESLSKWIKGMHSRPSPVITVEEYTKNSEKQRDPEGSEKQLQIETQVPALQDKDSILPSENQSLPFVKNAVLWKTIESMEVFQRIPQRPHFKPLEQFKESSREGLAIGYMVTFSSMVEKASKLQFNDPENITDDILETLADLEQYGFDVKVVQDRVTKLLGVKDKHGKLFDEMNELNAQILEHNRKQSEMDEEMREMCEQIRKIDEEMREKKSLIQEKILHIESAKKNEDIEIAFSRARLEKVEERIKNVEHEFE